MKTRRPSGQTAFDLSPSPNYSLNRFEVGDSNRAAFTAVSAWPDWPSPILLLIGPKGAGKTHLGCGWAQDLAHGTITQKLSDVPHGNPVFIDEADKADETALFTVMNLALNGQIPGLLLAARRPPQEWDIQIKDLRSRLVNTPSAIMSDHDDDILEPIVRKLFDDLGRDVRADIVTYLIAHGERSVEALKPVVADLDLAAREAKRDLTRAFTSQYLKTAASLKQPPLL